MVKPVNGNTLFRILPKKELPGLKNIVNLSSFKIGKNQLVPCLTGLFQKLGCDLKEIHLDNVAKIRLLGMSPSLEQRIEKGETIDKIFSDLELSFFVTEDQDLYILGDPKNVAQMKKPPLPFELEDLKRLEQVAKVCAKAKSQRYYACWDSNEDDYREVDNAYQELLKILRKFKKIAFGEKIFEKICIALHDIEGINSNIDIFPKKVGKRALQIADMTKDKFGIELEE